MVSNDIRKQGKLLHVERLHILSVSPLSLNDVHELSRYSSKSEGEDGQAQANADLDELSSGSHFKLAHVE